MDGKVEIVGYVELRREGSYYQPLPRPKTITFLNDGWYRVDEWALEEAS